MAVARWLFLLPWGGSQMPSKHHEAPLSFASTAVEEAEFRKPWTGTCKSMVLYYIAEEPSKRLPSSAFAVPTSCSSSSSCRTPTMYYYNSTTTALLATSILQVTLDSSWKRHKIWDKPEIKVTLRLLRQATSSTMAFRMKKDIVVGWNYAHGIHVLIYVKLQVLSRIILSNGVSAFFTQLSSAMKVQHTGHVYAEFFQKVKVVRSSGSKFYTFIVCSMISFFFLAQITRTEGSYTTTIGFSFQKGRKFDSNQWPLPKAVLWEDFKLEDKHGGEGFFFLLLFGSLPSAPTAFSGTHLSKISFSSNEKSQSMSWGFWFTSKDSFFNQLYMFLKTWW